MASSWLIFSGETTQRLITSSWFVFVINGFLAVHPPPSSPGRLITLHNPYRRDPWGPQTHRTFGVEMLDSMVTAMLE